MLRSVFLLSILLSLFVSAALSDDRRDTHELWHTVTLQFAGPQLREEDPATFRDYRLTVTFTNGERQLSVPGFFAADGQAAQSHATRGRQWQVRFTPDTIGEWSYRAKLTQGARVAIERTETAEEIPLQNATGRFRVVRNRSDGSQRDFRAHGRLNYVGKRYLQFAGSKKYFLKGGSGGPENFLAFAGFDGTWDDAQNPEFPSLGKDQLHHYVPHRRDWVSGDPDWTSESGHDAKGIVGVVNYLAAQGINSLYFMPFTLEGDGCDVWPWADPRDINCFDVSKLDQWEILFQHMQAKGIHLHMVLTETENESLFEIREGTDEFADSRKLYYREMIARFGHHLALTWNLGEESGWTDEKGVQYGEAISDQQRVAFAEFIRENDPYAHPLTVHDIQKFDIYTPLLGKGAINGPSLQRHDNYHQNVLQWINKSADAGEPWIVSMDEPLGWEYGLRPDEEDPTRDVPRRQVLWPTLLAGGYGVDWYFGWQNNSPHSDLSCEDLRVREEMWKQTKIALTFFRDHIPFHRMRSVDPALVQGEGHVFADPDNFYLVYLNSADSECVVDLSAAKGQFEISWFDPRIGGNPVPGTIRSVHGGSKSTAIGSPKGDRTLDWAALIRRVEP